jgi:hypothetical protein
MGTSHREHEQLPELAYQLGRFMGGRRPFLNRAQRQAREKVRQQAQSLRDHAAGMHAHVNNYDPDCSECATLTPTEHAARYTNFREHDLLTVTTDERDTLCIRERYYEPWLRPAQWQAYISEHGAEAVMAEVEALRRDYADRVRLGKAQGLPKRFWKMSFPDDHLNRFGGGDDCTCINRVYAGPCMVSDAEYYAGPGGPDGIGPWLGQSASAVLRHMKRVTA